MCHVLNELKNIPMGQIDRNSLVDINEVVVDRTLPKEERIAEYLRQIKNPYLFKCGKFVVRASFSESGTTLEDCLRGIMG